MNCNQNWIRKDPGSLSYDPSLSSIIGQELGDVQIQRKSTPSAESNIHKEVFGLRRLAKTFIGTKLDSDEVKVDLGESSGTKKRTFNYLNCLNGVPYTTKRPKLQERKTYTKYTEEQLHSNFQRNSSPNKATELIENLYLFNNSGIYDTTCIHAQTEYRNEQKKDVVIDDVPLNTGIESILNQVYGGSIARIEPYYKGSYLGELKKIEIKFISPAGAQEFMKYGQSNLFKVNGIHLHPKWSSSEDTLNYEKIFNRLSSHAEKGNICRCLILKKYPTRNTLKYVQLNKQPPLDTIDILDIKNDFEQYGQILDVVPVISRKLCISIIYYDILSAVKAMQSYEDNTTYTHEKYYSSWAIWYGKDLTDRPAFLQV
ncbi:Sporulation-specific protein 2 [Nakaseomyces bracarensis]|uniref:Sporulation-specific protein 2 n=1 Tax=Nakaseomyces bracarensis TaxID=273131 RepID=A0ABR4NVG8_9SACH